MNAAGQLAVREDAALNAIKAKLGIATSGGSNHNNNNNANPNGSTSTNNTTGTAAPNNTGGGGGMSSQLQSIVDVFLLRFMRNKKLNIDETMEKLRRRREFEGSLSGISVTPACTAAGRAGIAGDLGASGPSSKGQLQQELREERDRRIALEHKKKKCCWSTCKLSPCTVAPNRKLFS
ncbi:Hypothetical protein, putative [Bodo saltans]|uniref:DUF7353 domain-containing protein n=1 Tax=Bodo saltans TaxID=75058 RepID=A0A0S4IJF9_BODSA|nr:Hypothetical protein, putative [Bodo saltans]|eukprot:CUE83545.1 Hypothetical protein, putative [Bodo saltans]